MLQHRVKNNAVKNYTKKNILQHRDISIHKELYKKNKAFTRLCKDIRLYRK